MKIKTENSQIYWILLVIVWSLIEFIFNIVYIYIPVANIEKTTKKTASDIEFFLTVAQKTAMDLENASIKIDKLITDISPFIEQIEEAFCQFVPSSPFCKKNVKGFINHS